MYQQINRGGIRVMKKTYITPRIMTIHSQIRPLMLDTSVPYGGSGNGSDAAKRFNADYEFSGIEDE